MYAIVMSGVDLHVRTVMCAPLFYTYLGNDCYNIGYFIRLISQRKHDLRGVAKNNGTDRPVYLHGGGSTRRVRHTILICNILPWCVPSDTPEHAVTFVSRDPYGLCAPMFDGLVTASPQR